MGRVKRRREKDEAEGKERQAEWMVGLWANARALHSALTANSDLPPTKAQHEGKEKPRWPQIEAARRKLMEANEEFHKALASPRHFGAFVGLPEILGEPPAEEVVTAETARHRREENAERKGRLISALRGHAEKHGNAPLFDPRSP